MKFNSLPNYLICQWTGIKSVKNILYYFYFHRWNSGCGDRVQIPILTLLTARLWASALFSLSFSFLTYKIRLHSTHFIGLWWGCEWSERALVRRSWKAEGRQNGYTNMSISQSLEPVKMLCCMATGTLQM